MTELDEAVPDTVPAAEPLMELDDAVTVVAVPPVFCIPELDVPLGWMLKPPLTYPKPEL